MRIDDSGQYRSACGIDDYNFVRNLEISRLSNGNNPIPLNSNKTISDGTGTRAVNYDPIGYD
jgi:hypothetical protein